MTDTTKTTVKLEDGTIGHLAPNVKSVVLQEVEDDATYITEKRIKEHHEERSREAEKLSRATSKTKSDSDKKG